MAPPTHAASAGHVAAEARTFVAARPSANFDAFGHSKGGFEAHEIAKYILDKARGQLALFFQRSKSTKHFMPHHFCGEMWAVLVVWSRGKNIYIPRTIIDVIQ